MSRQWHERIPNMQAQFTQDVAESARKQIRKRIPNKPEWKHYRRHLEVVEVKGQTEGETGHALRVPNKKAALSKKDVKKTVVYVRPRRGNVRVSEKILVLAQFSPWTMDTLPFTPPPGQATLVSRKVSAGEVKAVARLRNADRPKWQLAMAKAGHKKKKELDIKPGASKTNVLPDIAYQALREEFQGKSHWRPGIIKVRKEIPTMIKKDPKYTRALLDPDFKEWIDWPRKTKHRITRKDALKFNGFVDRLGFGKRKRKG
jgi:hypothetical protein